MGMVWVAKNLDLNAEVAIKLVRFAQSQRTGTRRLLIEAQATAKLIHPHILPLHDSGEADGFLFFVMPFVRGETLRDRKSVV